MRRARHYSRIVNQARVGTDWRLSLFLMGLSLFAFAIVLKLFFVQIINRDKYDILAAYQYLTYREYEPRRGDIFITEFGNDDFMPIAENRKFIKVYAVPNEVRRPDVVASKLAPLLEMDEDVILARLTKQRDPYEPLKSKVTEDVMENIMELSFEGIYSQDETFRFYPLGSTASHLTGFVGHVGNMLKGQYGAEGYFEELLSGRKGYIEYAKDAIGRFINVVKSTEREAIHGSSIVLTIDRIMQFKICEVLKEAVEGFSAEGGTVILMEVDTAKIRAMCSEPSFDANTYFEVDDIGVYNNPAVFSAYEPGSVFKPITLASAINEEKIAPDDTYIDEGKVVIGEHTIKNSEGKAHGEVNMIEVLTESLNTGAVHAVRKLGQKKFLSYVENFGFGTVTGIELAGERPGTIESLYKRGEIYSATASYGQGITATPIQLISAFGALARNGIFVKPTVIEKIIDSSGNVTRPEERDSREVVTSRAATLINSMMVTVIEEGHAKAAKVDGYVLAGKTGTAQIANVNQKGYSDKYNHTFIGFGPIDNPKFVLLVKLNNPTSYPYAAGTAAPLFGQVAKFVLQYYNIPPTLSP